MIKIPIQVGIIGFSLHEQETLMRIFDSSQQRERCYLLKDITQNEPIDVLIVKTATESALKKLQLYESNHLRVPIVTAGKSALEGFEHHISGVLLASRVLKVLDAIEISANRPLLSADYNAEHAIDMGGQYDILVVNDDKAMRGILKEVLLQSEIPLNIDFAKDESSAIEKIQGKYYDFLFIDSKISNFSEIEHHINAEREAGVRSSVVMPIAEESVADDAYIVLRVLKAFADADDLTDDTVVFPCESGDCYSVLVVDDSELMHKSIKIELDKAEVLLQTDFAFSGEQALEKILQKHYDFIFLDVMMEGIDGFETCAHIRKLKGMSKVPIIMLTSKTSPLDEVKGIMAGCNTYLIKPINPNEFQKMLARIMRWLRDVKQKM